MLNMETINARQQFNILVFLFFILTFHCGMICKHSCSQSQTGCLVEILQGQCCKIWMNSSADCSVNSLRNVTCSKPSSSNAKNWELFTTHVFENIHNILVRWKSYIFLYYCTQTLLVMMLITYMIQRKKVKSGKRYFKEGYQKYLMEECYAIPRKYKCKSPGAWKFMFEFKNISVQVCAAYPFTLNQYVGEIVKEHKSAEELMKYEWSRYLSFKTFPMDCVMTPMRLAQAGFYYTGHGQEVKCFCCGMTNGDWTTDETAIEVHKRLSSNCRFICRERTDNVEIHNTEYYDDIYRPFVDSLSSVGRISGATGGPMDIRNHYTISKKRGISPESREEGTPGSGEYQRKDLANPADQGHDISTSVSEKQTGENIHVKHPEYSDLAARVSSFLNWTSLDVQDPVELASAGFFYTGVRDFVRCFYCGVGLKNWDMGDQPVQEHTRWSPACGYLQQLSKQGGASAHSRSSQHAKASSATATPIISKSENSLTATSGSLTAASGSGTQHTVTNSNNVAVTSDLKTEYSREPLQDSERKCQDSANNIPKRSSALSEREATRSSSASKGHDRGRTSQDIEEGKRRTSEKGAPKPTNEARLLREENKSLRLQLMCKICMDRDADVVFLPCGHMVACQTCAVALRKCAICRKLIKGTVRVYQG